MQQEHPLSFDLRRAATSTAEQTTHQPYQATESTPLEYVEPKITVSAPLLTDEVELSSRHDLLKWNGHLMHLVPDTADYQA